MVFRSQYCQEGDDARFLFKETFFVMVGIRWQIKPNLWWPRRKEECLCFLILQLKFGSRYFAIDGILPLETISP